MKTLRKVKPNPNDPTWTFPYATRKYVEKLRRYFLKEIIPAGQLWRSKANPVLPKKVSLAMRKRGIQWPSVPRRFRKQVNDWYIKKRNEWIAEHGSITRAKDQSLKMNAACYGRYVLTGKRLANRTNYICNKRIWLLYRQHEMHEQLQLLPPTPSKFLDVM